MLATSVPGRWLGVSSEFVCISLSLSLFRRLQEVIKLLGQEADPVS
jgi:hypothetical protein